MEKKPTTVQIRYLREIFENNNGVIKSSDWVSGSGRYTSKRAVPPYCQRYERYEKNMPTHVKDFFDKNICVKKVVAVSDMKVVQVFLEELDNSDEKKKKTSSEKLY